VKLRIVVIEGPDKGRVFVFEHRDSFVVGRSPDASLSVSRDLYFSRHHFLLEIDPPNVLLRDLKSANGTFLNDGDERVTDAPLRDGDVIRAGKTRIKLALGPSEAAPRAAPDEPEGAARPAARGSVGDGPPPAPDVPVEVLCERCAERAEREQPRARAEHVVYFCEQCRVAILKKPVLLNGYSVVREIGRGSMGAVYLATEDGTGTHRALKMVLPNAAMSEKARGHFVRDAEEQVKLLHPRIVRVLALRETRPGVFCMAMEHVDGPSAEELLAREGGSGLEPGRAATIIAQALEGLGFAHQAGVVHRDVKEANILVGRDASGRVDVKLSDFGLARSFATSGASGFTHAGELGGAAHYMAPEQILNFRDARPSADIYSMGAAFYRLLSGAFPIDFGARDPFLAVLEDPIVPLKRRKPSVPEGLAAVAERALGKRPEDRFATAEDMRGAILAALG
jgi:eukaryotic-like serine/threonine-protein kinase